MTKLQRYAKRLGRWGPVLLLLPLLSACSTGMKPEKEVSASIDPPPSAIGQEMLDNAALSSSTETSDVVTVYLLDRNDYLAPMSMRIDSNDLTASKTAAEEAIAWMTADKRLKDQLPDGFTAVLPEGTKVSSVTTDPPSGTVTVDFAEPLPTMAATKERKVIEALVWSLTELPGVNKVKLTVKGKPIGALAASGLPVDNVLTRGLGINVESGTGVQVNRSMAVTLYFSAQSAAGEGYFVPVTRLINRQQDAAKAALEQLILGPQNAIGLKPVLTSDMSIEQLNQMADTVNVSLRDVDWVPKSPVPAQMMEAIVLTLTEATDLPQVRVVMNGDDALVDSNNTSYEYPVTRPLNVNPLSK
jgi:germination protein M